MIAPIARCRPRTAPPQGAAPRAHLIGIAGSGMQALSEVLLARGWQISGSDPRIEAAAPLRERGVRLLAGHGRQAIDGNEDVVIYSAAVPADNVERRHAARLGLRQCSYPQAVGELMADARGLSIAGTHGKSTTTAMIAEILCCAGLDPTVICGAVPTTGRSGGRAGRGPWVVAEACEYREHFLQQRPEIAVVLSIEPDHFDFFRNAADLTAAFSRFVRGVDTNGVVLLNADCPAARLLSDTILARTVTFGCTDNADFRAVDVTQTLGRHRFRIVRHGRTFCRVNLRVPGRHQVSNALAAAAAVYEAGATAADIADGLSQFCGLRRRLEHVATIGGIDVVDDYAHHPTEIRATLGAVRQMFPGRRVWALFEPHQASRTAALLDEFAASLHNADRVAVTDVFAAREAKSNASRRLAEELVVRTRGRGADVLSECHAETIIKQIAIAVRPGDVIVTLGAGDIRKRCDDLIDRL